MRRLNRNEDQRSAAALQRVEALLRDAADYDVETPAPPWLARAAMARLKERTAVSSGPRPAAILAGVLVGAAAALAVAGVMGREPATARWTVSPGMSIEAAGPASSMGSAGAPRTASQQQALVAVRLPEQSRGVIGNPEAGVDTTARGGLPLRPATCTTARGHRRGRSRPPRALWEVETISREYARVLSPGWLVEAEDSSGRLIVSPAVLETEFLLPGDRRPGSEVVDPGQPIAPFGELEEE